MHSVAITIGNHAATLTGFEGEQVTLVTPEAAAPGARLFCTFGEGVLSAGQVLKVKVHRCVKVDDGFRINGKAFDLRRAMRETLQERFAAAAS